ncbi:hypothetical protein P744_0106480 [Enterococcus faecium UC10237]|uniref:hypothetical protein n=1 Tax=Enterococcus faecium TaxID=1352 RepID=UPI0002A403BD|nr:hypothetical protein [Enterococcus faecium]ELB12737.1 hypothetical protein OIM_03353 [Enterococcus faecium EnGen0032]EOH44274.1 hypothetical protein SSI_02392 [Enterococcus faecium EnGen0191]KEI57690.1 hypothetical protein P744_0106480 [Enterococcus faecium UC10237]MCD4922315.1 hypothetical protein [Enterococcus faecium]MCD5025266.1 hypothetical protein [Enterococcus faecium]
MNDNYDYIKLIEKIRAEKDMDELAALFMNIISLAGLKMDEVAALNYFIAEQTIRAEHNAKFLKDRLDLDVKGLGVEGIFKVQEALVNVYVSKIKK